jgi:hypothetical protein
MLFTKGLLWLIFMKINQATGQPDAISSSINDCPPNSTAVEFQTIIKLKLTRNKLIVFKSNDILVVECPVEEIFSHKLIRRDDIRNYFINWYKNNRRLVSTVRRIRQSEQKLVIKRLFRVDRGVYYCEIVTGVGINLKSPSLTLTFNGMRVFFDYFIKLLNNEKTVLF